MMGGLVVVALLGAAANPGAAGAHTVVPSAQAVAATAPPLLLESQTATVTAGQAFDLRFRPGSLAVPTAQLGVSVTVYACLSSISGFDQSVAASTPSGTVISSTHTALPLATLPRTPEGWFDLSMRVVSPLTPSSATSTGTGFTIALSSAGGQCGGFPAGVYPVRVQLVNTTTQQTVGGLTTHLVYSNAPSDTQKLLFALVLPIRATFTPAADPTVRQLLGHPSAALAPLSTAATASVVQTVAKLAAHDTVPVTLEPSRQTIDALTTGSPTPTGAVSELTTLATVPLIHQFIRAPYAPVNANGLVTAGLADELSRQVTRGGEILGATADRAAGATAASGALGVWATNDGLDTSTLTQLAADGYTRVVVPATTVTSPPTNGSTAEPFVLTSSRGAPVGAIASGSDLASRFTGSPGNPVLAAHQLIAELAQIYYEKPNDTTARAVVALPPTSWSDNPLFVDALLAGLAASPIIRPVTVDTVFSTVATSTCRSTCRPTAVTGSPALPVASIRVQRQRVDTFSAAASASAPTARTVSSQLGDLILAGESDTLRPAQQSAVLRNTGRALNAQLTQFAVAGDRSITLTSQQGTLPIDLTSSAPYPVSASLTVTSDKLLFPNGATQWTKPDTIQVRPGTNIVEVPFTARTSGQFTVDVTIRTPSGGLVLSRGEISVRSTATSVVGVVLSLGALVVLAVWWFRTSRKRRAARSHDEVSGTPGATEPG